MDYMLPSRNNDTLLINSGTLTGHENINSRQEDPPMFLQFPSPFVDDMDTTTIIPNLHHDQHYSDDCRTTTISTLDNPLKIMKTTTETLPSKLKCVRKRRIAGKKDRHSKIYTAQGLRDRRMRLSVHTARKFFDLNDMLGFDKASKTIEWLFSKSKKAIEEVAGGLQADDTTIVPFRRENIESQSPLTAGEIEPAAIKIVKVAAEKDANLELRSDQIEDESSQKPKESYPLIKKSRSKVRERARDRTRERMMIKHLEKPRRLFEADASADFDQPQLGFEGNSDNHIMEESSCLPLDYSNIYHFVKHLHLDNTIGNNDSYVGNVTTISSTNCSTLDYNKTIAEPPTGWLNSKNTFLGFIGGWDSEYSRMESGNGIVQNFGPFTDSINGENPSSGIISTSSFMNFHSQNQG